MTTHVEAQQGTMYEDAPATAALSDKVHDLVQALSEKLDCLWRYDEYIEDCEDDQASAGVFRAMKEDDLRHVAMLRDQIERLCKSDQFC